MIDPEPRFETGMGIEERMRVLGWEWPAPETTYGTAVAPPENLAAALGIEAIVADLGDLPPGSGHYEFWRKGVL